MSPSLPQPPWNFEPISTVQHALECGTLTSEQLVKESLRLAQRHPSSYTCLLEEQALSDARASDDRRRAGIPARSCLEGIPFSVKDLFDVKGVPTTCGSSFHAGVSPLPKMTSPLIAAWEQAGAILVGKTHLNEFAYGLTGENATFGDCTQPLNSRLLTGGSSSGAAASVLSGSSFVGLGTDTGGSIRVPSALCGLVGFRCSAERKSHPGMFPLAPSYDTFGWIQRHLSDLPLLYHLVFSRHVTPHSRRWRIGVFTGHWLEVCLPEILDAYSKLMGIWSGHLMEIRSFLADDLISAVDLFSPLQAREASEVHRDFLNSHFEGYEPAVRQRLAWGRSLESGAVLELREKESRFVEKLNQVWNEVDLLLAPACPVVDLEQGQDHTAIRRNLLQLTTPFSLAGFPALTFPWGPGNRRYGWQLLAPIGQEERLIQLIHQVKF